jgi:hypothetical protein
MMERFYIFLLYTYMFIAIVYYIFYGQFNKHIPSMTKEEWDKKL